MKVFRLARLDVEYMPDRPNMQDGVLYVSDMFGLAIHLCACGCRVETVTPLGLGAWELTEGPTLHPSIGNMQLPCGSHYWVRSGEIVPC